MNTILTVFITVTGDIIGYYIIKWLDGDKQ